jgi:hypothetical protein
MITKVSEEYSTSIFRVEQNQVRKMADYIEKRKNETCNGR